MKQYIRKADIILLIALVVLGLAATALLSRAGSATSADAEVVIRSGGELFATYPLNKDVEIEVPAPSGTRYDNPRGHALSADDESTHYTYYNTVIIKGGEVTVSASSCKNQVCVRHGAISKSGQSIVCLPNRLIVTIEDKSGGEYDSITS